MKKLLIILLILLFINNINTIDVNVFASIWLSYINEKGIRIPFPPKWSIDPALILSVLDFNRRIDSVQKDYGNIDIKNCPYNISLLTIDSQANTKRVIKGFNSLENIKIVLGSSLSVISKPLNILASSVDAAQIGTVATAPELSNKEQYPTFARVVGHSSSLTYAKCKLYKILNFKQIALLYQNDEFGKDYVESLFKECNKLNIIVQSFGYINTIESINEAIINIKNTKLNIIEIQNYAQMDETIEESIIKNGLYMPNKLFILQETGGVGYKRIFHGSITIIEKGENEVYGGNDVYKRLVKRYKNIKQEDIDLINQYLPPNSILEEEEQNNSDLQIDKSYFDELINNLPLTYVHSFWDAPVLAGLTICNIHKQGKNINNLTGDEIFEEIKKIKFHGTIGEVELDENGDRKRELISYAIDNHINSNFDFSKQFILNKNDYSNYNITADSKIFKPDYKSINVGIFENDKWNINFNKIKFSDNTKNIPLYVDKPNHNHNYISSGLKIAGLILLSLCYLLILIIFYWLTVNRLDKNVKGHQVEFLYLLLIGCTFLSSSILPIISDDNPNDIIVKPENICMSLIWLYVVGFTISFVALFIKLFRLLHIYKTGKVHKKQIKIRDTIIVFGTVFTEIVILIVWTLYSPLIYKREIISYDIYDFVVESSASCIINEDFTTESYIFIILIIMLNILLLIFGGILSYKTRLIPIKYNDGSWITLSMLSLLQLMVITIPTLIVVYFNVIGRVIVLSFFVFTSTMSILLFTFIPKIFNKYFDVYNSSNSYMNSNDGNNNIYTNNNSNNTIYKRSSPKSPTNQKNVKTTSLTKNFNSKKNDTNFISSVAPRSDNFSEFKSNDQTSPLTSSIRTTSLYDQTDELQII